MSLILCKQLGASYVRACFISSVGFELHVWGCVSFACFCRSSSNPECEQVPVCECQWEPKAPPSLWLNSLTFFGDLLSKASNSGDLVSKASKSGGLLLKASKRGNFTAAAA